MRLQVGRELAKEKSTKSGQSTDELYKSSWIHYQKLSFLILVIRAGKSRDTLKRNNQSDEAIEIDKESTTVPKKEVNRREKARLINQVYGCNHI